MNQLMDKFELLNLIKKIESLINLTRRNLWRDKTIKDIDNLNNLITNPDNWNDINLINKSQENLNKVKTP